MNKSEILQIYKIRRKLRDIENKYLTLAPFCDTWKRKLLNEAFETIEEIEKEYILSY